MATTRLDLTLKQDLKDFGVLNTGTCFNCGSCTGICPLSQEDNGFPRKLIRYSQLGTIDFENEDIWTCATCRACAQLCPREVKTIDFMTSLRRVIVQEGAGYLPKSLRRAMVNVAGVGNPLGEAPQKRGLWTEGLGVRPFTPNMELLLFTCCYGCYDPVVRRSSSAIASILKHAGVDFGILSPAEERCCGESVNKAGNEKLFQELATQNIQTFKEKGARRIVVISPHCYDAFKNEYPRFGASFEVLHYTQYLAQLINEGRLKLTKEVAQKVTYHDPCYLGRHNGIYSEPREVLRSIPGLELVEMPFSGKTSFCCGGGGGRIWMETKKEGRISDLRLQQAAATGAGVLAVACSYCMVNLEDSNLSGDGSLAVKDISELVQQSI